MDSKKDVDNQLKCTCEVFIKHVIDMLASELLAFQKKVRPFSTSDANKIISYCNLLWFILGCNLSTENLYSSYFSTGAGDHRFE